MENKKDKLYKTYISKKNLVFYSIIFLIALISGTFFNLILNNNDTNLIIDYLTNFLSMIRNNNINYIDSFINSLIFNCGSIIVIWLLGYIVIAIPIILVIYFFKSFILGFSISALISNFKIKGILYSFIYLFPHALINICLNLIQSIISIYISIRIVKALIKKKKLNIGTLFKKSFIILIIFLFLTFLTTIYEIFILPKVFNLLI